MALFPLVTSVVTKARLIFLKIKFDLFLRLIEVFFLWRFGKIYKLINKFEYLLDLKDFEQGLFSFTKLLFIIVYLIHFCGCCWSYGAYTLMETWDCEVIIV